MDDDKGVERQTPKGFKAEAELLFLTCILTSHLPAASCPCDLICHKLGVNYRYVHVKTVLGQLNLNICTLMLLNDALFNTYLMSE